MKRQILTALFVVVVVVLAGPRLMATSPDCIYYIDSSGNVNELRFNGSSWSTTNITSTTSGTAASTGSRLTGHLYWSSSDNVWYVGTDSHIHEFAYYGSPATWHSSDITSLASGPNAATNSPLASFGWTVASTHNDVIFYVAASGDIHELEFNGSTWSDQDLTSAASAPAFSFAGPDSLSATLDPAYGSYGEAGVFYIDGSGYVEVIFGGNGPWSATNISSNNVSGGNGYAASNTNLNSHMYENALNVYYIEANGDLCYFTYYDVFGDWYWYADNITTASGGSTPGSTNTPLTGMQNGSTFDDIFFITSTPDVYMDWFNSSAWAGANVTSLSSGSSPDSSRAMASEMWENITPEVFSFLSNGDVYENAFYSNAWHAADISSIVSAPAARSGSPIVAFTGI